MHGHINVKFFYSLTTPDIKTRNRADKVYVFEAISILYVPQT
jgi:hypothetical protein